MEGTEGEREGKREKQRRKEGGLDRERTVGGLEGGGREGKEREVTEGGKD